jgi:hypothetical protein
MIILVIALFVGWFIQELLIALGTKPLGADLVMRERMNPPS